MFAINGTGLRFLGIKRNDDGTARATVWITILFAPILPLRREHVLPISRNPRQFSYKIINKLPLDFVSVLKTYLIGWIAIPIMLFGPLFFAAFVFAAKEFVLSSGWLSGFAAWVEIAGDVFMGLGIIWLIVAVWKLKDWDERRWFKK